jgi:hypothetical protein
MMRGVGSVVLGLVIAVAGCNRADLGPELAAQRDEAMKALRALGATIEPDNPTSDNPVVAINLSGDKVSDDTLTYVARFPKLKKLSLKNTAVTSAGLTKLAGSVSLDKLDLSGCAKIGDEGLTHIAHLAGITDLGLSNTSMTDAGMASVGKLTGLKTLELGYTAVGDAGLAHLKGMIILNVLRLEGTKVTDAGLDQLKGLKDLKMVNVTGTPVTAAGVEKFRSDVQAQKRDVDVVQ